MAFPRDLQPELMDDAGLSPAEHQHALRGLSRLNQFSGVVGSMYALISRFATSTMDRPLRVLDVASGSGDLPVAWARRAAKAGQQIEFTATDISPVAVKQQQLGARTAGVPLTSIQADCFASELPSGFDVVTCSLFMHHLTDDQVISLLRAMRTASTNAVIVCDLERSRLNWCLVGFASRTLTRSRIVHTDALLSVRNAFTTREFSQLAQNALGSNFTIERRFPCRFVLVDQRR